MLFVTFMQVPLVTLLDGLRNLRFIGALLAANFIGIPLLLLLTRPLLPDVPLVQFGILLVLLAPCIDYAVTFCHLGRGDAARLLACTPLLLAMQLLLLPLYLALFLDDAAAALISPAPFIWLILMPLIGAGLLQHIQSRFLIVQRIANAAGWLPVPATAVVIFLVVASVVPQLELAIGPVRQTLPFYLLFAVAAPCIGASTARQFNVTLPAQTLETLIPHVQVIDKAANLLGFLKKLDWGVAVLGSLDACRRVAYENVEDAVRAGLDYTELRFSPYYMAQRHALLYGAAPCTFYMAQRHALLYGAAPCTLYGAAPCTLYGAAPCTYMAQRHALPLQACRYKIVALDLAGDELGFPGGLFTSHFRQARDNGWHITVHAGEAADAESIWQAIRQLGAERIGHGVAAIVDKTLMTHMAQQQIAIESCLTSNIQTSTVMSLAEHPLPHFLRHGIPATINTDDPAVQGIEITHEYLTAAPQAGLTTGEIRQAQQNGLAVAFLSEQDRQRIREKVQRKRERA